jgi:hypothetical protein
MASTELPDTSLSDCTESTSFADAPSSSLGVNRCLFLLPALATCPVCDRILVISELRSFRLRGHPVLTMNLSSRSFAILGISWTIALHGGTAFHSRSLSQLSALRSSIFSHGSYTIATNALLGFMQFLTAQALSVPHARPTPRYGNHNAITKRPRIKDHGSNRFESDKYSDNHALARAIDACVVSASRYHCRGHDTESEQLR